MNDPMELYPIYHNIYHNTKHTFSSGGSVSAAAAALPLNFKAAVLERMVDGTRGCITAKAELVPASKANKSGFNAIMIF
jgi:hypothetical protein